jgi:hypothetical protein
MDQMVADGQGDKSPTLAHSAVRRADQAMLAPGLTNRILARQDLRGTWPNNAGPETTIRVAGFSPAGCNINKTFLDVGIGLPWLEK